MTDINTDKNTNKGTAMVIDFGIRNLNKLRVSKSVIIPKVALENCVPVEANSVHVKLVQENDQKYIRIDPICNSQEESKN